MSRDRYERMTKDQLVEQAVAMKRDRHNDQQHRAAIKRDLERAQALQAASIVEMDAKLGGTFIHDLLLAIHDIIEAGDPLSSAPTENTMRVTNPSSTVDEGAATRHYRRMRGSVRWHLERTTATLRNNLERDPDLADKRRFAALRGHHSRGLHDDEPNTDCSLCV